jgi:hypothetical protein
MTISWPADKKRSEDIGSWFRANERRANRFGGSVFKYLFTLSLLMWIGFSAGQGRKKNQAAESKVEC